MSSFPITTNNLQYFSTQNLNCAGEGPRGVPITLDFSSNTSYSLDLGSSQARLLISLIQAFYFDNTLATTPLTVYFPDSDQSIICPANTEGYLNCLCPGNVQDGIARMRFSSASGAVVKIKLLNFPVINYIWPNDGAVTSVTGTLPIVVSSGLQPVVSVNDATSSTVGVVKPDNSTITISGGVLSAVGTLKLATLTLTATQINAMFTTPLQIVAAQGAGTLIKPQAFIANAIFGSAAFTGGGAIALYWGNAPIQLATSTIAATLLTSFATNQCASPNTGFAVQPSSAILNQGLFISNATNNFAAGTGCSMKVFVLYEVISGLS